MPLNIMVRRTAVAVLLAFLATANIAHAADIAGGKDHPLVGRYTGSEIAFYKASSFDEAALLQAPLDLRALTEAGDRSSRAGKEWLKLEGEVTKIRYTAPIKRSALEVIRNYEGALKSKGFQTLYTCAADCLTGKQREPYLLGEEFDPDNRNPPIYSDKPRYLLARLSRPEGAVYAAILAAEFREQTTVLVQVVETKDMETGKIVVLSAKEMDDEIGKAGTVNIYTIFFDFDRDSIKPESKPTLDEIAKMFGKNDLKLKIVGHTDNQGSQDYNLDLSRRRAASVVQALTSGYGISGSRLSSDGAGFSRPVASNDNDDGRARNRRVELIRQ
jgi:outer membrane protein OmpA-like peptidoglycan-associated protein